MRPIDADTLIEKVEKIQPWDAYLSKYAQGIRHCMELVSLLIKDAPTIEPERKTGKWIPVSERLPENDNDVLVQMNDGAMLVDFITESSNGWFWTEFGDKPIAWMPLPSPYLDYPKAWMPLPSPYREEGEE